MPMTGPPQAANSRTITLRFSLDLFSRFQAAATAERRSLSNMASILIDDGLSMRQSPTHST